MIKTSLVVLALLSLARPSFGKIYTNNYLVPCSEVWGGVKDALSNPENYVIVESDDAKMTAAYNVKHSIHVSVTGAIMQRTNKVALVS